LLECDVIDAIRSFPAGSAEGCDGLHPQRLKDTTIPLTVSLVMQEKIGFASDRICEPVSSRQSSFIHPAGFLWGVAMCSDKKDGGIWPIVVGCTLRRLVPKSVAKVVQEKMAAKMAPVQLGFGVKWGSKASAHAVRRFLQNIRPGQAVLKLDFKNAFNAISRDQIDEV
jgi:hypothetical protein